MPSSRAPPRARFDRPDEEAGASAESQHAAVGGGSEEFTPDEPVSDNVVKRTGFRRGDVAAALAASDVVVEGRFTTSWVHQGYLEPQVAMAELDEDGVLHVTSATQGTFYTRSELARLFGLRRSAVRVTGATLGGGFGGKALLIEPLVAAATLVLRRPVRLELTRNEDFRMTNPAPGAILDVRLGATRDGRLRGLGRACGSRPAATPRTASRGSRRSSPSGHTAGTPTRWSPTGSRPTGSGRAPTGHRARRRRPSRSSSSSTSSPAGSTSTRSSSAAATSSAPDDEMADGTPWGGLGLGECLDRVAAHPLWRDRASLPDGEGVGMAVGAWPGSRQPAAAICRLEADGRVTVVTGVVDISGTMTGFATIAAEGLGIAAGDVSVIAADTAAAPRSPMSGGSVITYSTGRAVQRATDALRDKILAYAAQLLEIDVRDLELVDGVVQPKGTPERGLTLAQIGESLDGFTSAFEPLEGHGGTVPPVLAPLTSAHLVHVRVDRETGSVEVLGYVIAQDVGRALNPAIIEGQLHGGATQGLGWALHEAMVYDDAGQLQTGTFLDYVLQTAPMVPVFETILVEVPAPDGPYGAKGIGEGPVCGAAAAVANAVTDATGVRFRELPMTPARVWRGVHQRGAGACLTGRRRVATAGLGRRQVLVPTTVTPSTAG